MPGDTYTPTSNTTRTLAIGLTVARRGSGGGLICVRAGLARLIFCGNDLIWSTVVVSERLMESVKACEIRSEIYGASDHCPVILEVEGFE